MEQVLDIKNIKKHFEGIKAVDGVNLSLSKGTIVGIFGENGAGKTTLFNLISGVEKIDEGEVYLMGHRVTHKDVLQRSRMGLGRLFQYPRVFDGLTLYDNLMAASKHQTGHHVINYLLKLKKIKTEEKQNFENAIAILTDFSLNEKKDQKASSLSVGERKLLSLGCLLMNGAGVILLDEPYAGINPRMIEHLNRKISDLKSRGFSFLIIEHNRSMMQKITDVCFELKNGVLIQSSTIYE